MNFRVTGHRRQIGCGVAFQRVVQSGLALGCLWLLLGAMTLAQSTGTQAGTGSSPYPRQLPTLSPTQMPDSDAGIDDGSDPSQQMPSSDIPGMPKSSANPSDASADGGQNDTSAGGQDSSAAPQPPLSANAIIRKLQQNPELLNGLRQALAEKSGVSSETISDTNIYERVARDPAAREVASQLIRAANPSGDSSKGKRVRNGANDRGAELTAQPEAQLPEQVKKVPRYQPYKNLPGLRGMYTQLMPNKDLKRFGSDALRNGTGNSEELSEDVPTGPDYMLGAGDSLMLNLWGGLTIRLERVIDRQGQIALPEAGPIRVTGLTITQAQEAIQKALARQYRNERVEISLGRVRSVRVYVVGDVQRPGSYDVSSLSSPLNVLYTAGGPTSRGSLRTLKLVRGDKLLREIDLYEFLLKGVHDTVDHLQPGDTIVVPPVGTQVTVSGMVRRPAIYELKGESSLKEVLDLAGGVEVTAELKKIEVERVEAHNRRTMTSLEYDTADPSKYASYTVRDGDAIRVSQIVPYNEQSVYLSGHVYRPGIYAWREGMTLADLIPSYQVLLPEPNDHAEIVRLRAPDLRPQTLAVDLADVLAGNIQVNLEAMDQVRIFGRYEIDAPSVAIRGEVLRPGDYPLSKDMTVADLVQMSGGLKRSAYREQADLTSYTVENGRNVQVHDQVVALDKALNGDRASNVLLRPGDVVGIRQITGWQDIGSSITIEGEVGHAGVYGIAEGERLSSVLKRASGFRNSAFPEGAILRRVQVQELEERNRQDIIRRLEEEVPNVGSSTMTGAEQTSLLQAMQAQRTQVLAALKSHPSDGRQVIRISANFNEWENTSADIELRAGDKLMIPKKPNFVLVSGQVYNAAAISFRPGKTAGWYLGRAGGMTQSANKSAIYIVRADGSVAGHGGRWFGGNALDLRLRPGDAVVVPEKILGGSQVWRNAISLGQVLATTSLAAAAAGVF